MKRNISGIVVAMLIMLAIVAIGHVAAYEAFIHFWNIAAPRTLMHLRLAFAVLAASFIVMSVVTMPFYTKVGSWLYALAAVWLGTLYWLFAASVLGAILLPFGTMPGRILFVAAIITSLYGILNSNATRVTRYTVAVKNLPEPWQNKKIAMVSDTHLGNVRGVRFAKKIVRMVNKESPEIVLIAGDFFDGPRAPFIKFASPLKGITAPKGAYFAEGNHEEFSASAKYDEALKSAGVHVLSNEKTEIDGIELIGINYNVSNSDEAAAKILATIGVRRDIPSILIKHAPNGIRAVADAGVDLQVSGHTHRGQTWPGSLLAKRIFGKFEYGMNRMDGLTVITGSGAGTWGPPQRVGTHAEIVMITLQNE